MSSETFMNHLRADRRDVVDDLLFERLRERLPDFLWLRHGVSPSWTRERSSRMASWVHFVRGGGIWFTAKLVEETGMRSRIASR